MNDVAADAGVSIATVSRVLNGVGYVSDSTQERVQQSLKDLGYRHNILARSLSTSRTNVIALFVGDISNPYFSALALGVEETANQNGLVVVLCNIGGSLEREISYVQNLLARRVDGLIFSESRIRDQTYVSEVMVDVPVVILDRQIPIPYADGVFLDQFGGAYEGTKYLIELGHRQIAHIAGPERLDTAKERLRGYQQALAEHGLRLSKRFVVRGDYTAVGGKQAMETLIRQGKPPTAVFAANDFMAIGAMSALGKEGLSVPDDISILGFDDIPLAALTCPPLTTVFQPIREIGNMAMGLLADRLSGKATKEPRSIVVRPSVLGRESTRRML